MTEARGRCSGCGVPIQVPIPDTLASAELASALCPSCTDQQFLDDGRAVLALLRELDGALFPLGKITITGGAVDALAEAGEHAAVSLARHVRGDWGEYGHCDEIQLTDDERRLGWEATDDSAKINKSNLLSRRDRIMSEYQTGRGVRLWVITGLDGATRETWPPPVSGHSAG